MKFLNLGCPQKLYTTCKVLSCSRFLCNCKYDIIKLNQDQFRFQTDNIQEEKKLATKEKDERKKHRICEYKFSQSV